LDLNREILPIKYTMAYLFVMAHSRQTQRYLVVSLFLPFNVNKQVTYRLKPTAAHLKATSNSLLSTFSSHVQESVNNIEPCFQGNPGLYNALVASNANTVWVGTLKTPVPEDEQSDIQAELIANYNSYPIFPSEKELDGHYNQFCKNVLWKPFHYQLDGYSKPSLCDEQAWEDYKCINMLFCIKVAEIYQPGDIIWINDYHLMLAPEILRKMLPNATIGFFLHIPFPSSEIFRCIYVRKELLHGMLGSDLIGFQTHSFLRQFLSTCSRLLAVPIHLKSIQLPNSSVSVGQYPIGIDHVSLQKKMYCFFDYRCHPEVNHLKEALREKYQGKLLVIGRDKNDYVKGVTHKLIAFEKFLEMYPKWIGKVVLIQVSLYTIESNDNGKQVSEMVTKINSKYGTISYTPVVYLHQDISFNHYLALLSVIIFLI
jgi:trehalose-6-phosphate synthase